MAAAARDIFWQHTRRWSVALLLVWLGVNLALPWFARDLDRYTVFGFPLGYWLAAEGALYIYLLIIVIYVGVMEVLEARLLAREDAAAAGGADVGER